VSGKARDYDSTVARIAGNVASGILSRFYQPGDGTQELAQAQAVAARAVHIARAIVAEVKRTGESE
jgi:hypothetical protein